MPYLTIPYHTIPYILKATDDTAKANGKDITSLEGCVNELQHHVLIMLHILAIMVNLIMPPMNYSL